MNYRCITNQGEIKHMTVLYQNPPDWHIDLFIFSTLDGSLKTIIAVKHKFHKILVYLFHCSSGTLVCASLPLSTP